MTRDQLIAMLGRKSVTVLAGFCLCAWVNAQWPTLLQGENLTALCAAALLAASAKLSTDNEKNGKGPKPA